MWIDGNYRRIFLDMHIDDGDERFLSRVDPEALVAMLKDAGAQQIVVKCRPHTGLAYYPTRIGRMHRGLRGRDYVREMTDLCHRDNIAAMGYFSQIFDNWAYDAHPEWRCVNGEGKTSREYEQYDHPSLFRRGRYGIVCPNHEGYRAYVRDCLTEIASTYPLDAIFLDMPFWPEVCYCDSCQAKYRAATGRELPRQIDWQDPAFRLWQTLREEWLGEFAAFSSACAKAANPHITVEHNASNITASWQTATTDLVAEASDYVGGDLFGGYLEQSFICKYYRNLSAALPFAYITSLCDPDLNYHTSIKSPDELLLHGVTALVHGGAFSICDGANPDGTLRERVYRDVVKPAFSRSAPCEGYVGGEMLFDAAIWFSSRSKYDQNERGSVAGSAHHGKDSHTHLQNALCLAGIFRGENIPFTVLPDSKLHCAAGKLLAIPGVPHISDEAMRLIESHVMGGGALYLSGRPGHPRLLELLEAEDCGMTDHDVTYIRPAQAGLRVFADFDSQSPMAVQGRMQRLSLRGEYDLLGTVTLPYTLTGTRDFASIHSNPPGIDTDMPAVIRKRVGSGVICWAAAPIESSRPYMSRLAMGRLLRELVGPLSFGSNAPAVVEVVGWRKGNEHYFAAINQQEAMPLLPIPGIVLTIPFEAKEAHLLPVGAELPVRVEAGLSTIALPELDVFHIVRVR